MNESEKPMSEGSGISCRTPRPSVYLSFAAVNTGENIVVGVTINNILCLTEDTIHEQADKAINKLIGEWKNWIEKNKD